MARGGSGLRTAIKIAKAIDRANRQAAREAQRQYKADQRAEAQALREQQRLIREAEREQKSLERLRKSEEKKAFKNAVAAANDEYLERCEERASLRKQFIQQVLR